MFKNFLESKELKKILNINDYEKNERRYKDMNKIFLVSFAIIILTMTLVMADVNDQGMQVGDGVKTSIQTGNYISEQGESIQIQMKAQNQFELKVGEATADCDCELVREKVEEKTKLYAKLSNGEHAEIKVMPDAASETALQRLRLTQCDEEEGCQIQLKEVGVGNQVKMAYEVKTQRSSKVLGLFRATMEVHAQVDAETGEIIRVRKPWWAFLASEPEE